MRISAKGRYALASLIEIARQTRSGDVVSVLSITDALGISKIFLEQIMALLKKGGLLQSIKGPKGGYQLAQSARVISVLDILAIVENNLLEKSESTVADHSPGIEAALNEKVFGKLDKAIVNCLSNITLKELLDCADQQNADQSFMLNM